MIHGVHALFYARDAERVRAFFRDVLRWPAVDAGGGWLIFALPPAELGIHPSPDENRHELWLMCEDVRATRAELEARGVRFTRPIEEVSFGVVTRLEIPGGGEMGLYQPKHPIALGLNAKRSRARKPATAKKSGARYAGAAARRNRAETRARRRRRA